MANHHHKILVTGASGHFGQLVLQHLLDIYDFPASHVIAISRNVEKLSDWASRGVEIRAGDFGVSDGLSEVFRGADKALIISTDSLDNAVRLATHIRAVSAAKEAGVGHLFYTSMPAPETSHVSFAAVHLGTEKAVKESGLKWTVLRNQWYSENVLLSILPALKSGALYSAAGDGKISYISRSDLARAAAAALLDSSGVENRTLNLTGGLGVDIAMVAALVSQAAGRPLAVVQVPLAELIDGMKAHGLPEFVATALGSFDQAARLGDLSLVTDDFETLTGRQPEAFEDWVMRNAGLLVA